MHIGPGAALFLRSTFSQFCSFNLFVVRIALDGQLCHCLLLRASATHGRPGSRTSLPE